MHTLDFSNTEYYINRELSWLEFNQRVLDEARDTSNPLFERIKFLAIVNSNLDEFFMVRVGSINDLINAGYNKPDFSGLTPKNQLKKISLRVHKMMEDQYNLYNRSILVQLKKYGVHFLNQRTVNEKQKAFLKDYFNNVVYPVLTPMAVDSGRPFPLIQNKTINIGALIKKDNDSKNYIFATVQVPSVLPRMVQLPSEKDNVDFILLEEVIEMNIQSLFTGKNVIATCPYRVTRNGDLSIDEDEAEDLLIEIEKSLKQRRWGQTVRLEFFKTADDRLIEVLKENLETKDRDVYLLKGPLDLTFLFKLYSKEGFEDVKFPVYKPQIPKDLIGIQDYFAAIREGDLFLHHPFESFSPLVEVIQNAAKDPKVLAIKQTLYRVSGKSPIVRALAEAAEAGKQVTVLVELKARFDEENNIHWAKQLEKAGCHVIYGLVGLKTHSKITLIVRHEEDGINRYVHLGTGNYNDVTANIYTDMGLLTCDKYIGEDASTVFNTLSGYTERPRLNKLVMAPTDLRKRFINIIKRESKNESEGKNAYIKAKMNSLVDPAIINELYKASISGVKIDLVVRGICCLRPGLQGLSENIKVKSIVGRYLEHSRIYCFCNDGNEEIYLSSADWMQRNLDRRVELLFPIQDKNIKNRINEIFEIILLDNMKARIMDSSGHYKKVDKKGDIINSQDYFSKYAIEKVSEYNVAKNSQIFVPRNPITSP